jgi:hypothetical protein
MAKAMCGRGLPSERSRTSPEPTGARPQLKGTGPETGACPGKVAPRAIDGHWRVRRISGLLPPGVTKRIAASIGQTLVFGRVFGTFDVVGDRFVYRFWPIMDVVAIADGDAFVGRGLFFGLPFCRFRLERLA